MAKLCLFLLAVAGLFAPCMTGPSSMSTEKLDSRPSLLSAPPPTNFTILEQLFVSKNNSLITTYSFTRPLSPGTPCTYYFDFFDVQTGKPVGSSRAGSNDVRRGFSVTGLDFGREYRVMGWTKCSGIGLPDSGPMELTTFVTISCLEATGGNLSLCVLSAPRNLTVSVGAFSQEKSSIVVEWRPPLILNATGHAIDLPLLDYNVSFVDVEFRTRPVYIPVPHAQHVLITGLLPGFTYIITVSATVAGSPKGPGKGLPASTEIYIPAPITTTTVVPLPVIVVTSGPTLPSEESTSSSSSSACPGLKDQLLPVSVCVGVGVGLLCLVVIAIVIALLMQRQRRQLKRARDRSTSLPSIAQALLPPIKQDLTRATTPAHQSLDNLIYLSCLDVPQISLMAPYSSSVPYTSLHLMAELDRGAFGVVHKAAVALPDNGDVVTVALKSVQPYASPEERQALLDEIAIMQKIPPHPNVVRMIGHLISTSLNSNSHLLLEYCELGSLKTYLTINRLYLTSLPVNSLQLRLLGFATQIADGMAHLSLNHIIHRDLAARNVLLTHDLQVKVADFGLSRAVPDYYRQQRPGKVPWKWYAPESLMAEGGTFHTTKSDVWSFGMVLYEIYSLGKAPWPHVDRLDQLEGQLQLGVRMAKPAGCTDDMYAIMQQCWQYAAGNRPDFCTLSTQLRAIRIPAPEEPYVYFSHIPAISKSHSNVSMDSAISGISS